MRRSNGPTTLPEELPNSPQIAPYAVEVEAERKYLWCSCGLSVTQPWCDGSHAGTAYEPITIVPRVTGTFYMCGCKKSERKPYCFGNCSLRCYEGAAAVD